MPVVVSAGGPSRRQPSARSTARRLAELAARREEKPARRELRLRKHLVRFVHFTRGFPADSAYQWVKIVELFD